MLKTVRYISLLLLAASIAVSSFAQDPESVTMAGNVTAKLQTEATSGLSLSVPLFPTLVGISVQGCESSGTGQVGCVSTALGGSGQYNYWWMWDGPGHLYQTNSDYVTINNCLDGEGSLTVQVFDRGTGETRLSSPYRVMCDCSPDSDACDIDVFGDQPCWPHLGICF